MDVEEYQLRLAWDSYIIFISRLYLLLGVNYYGFSVRSPQMLLAQDLFPKGSVTWVRYEPSRSPTTS